MSRHLLVHACGHEFEHDLDGPVPQQYGEAKRRAGEDCPVCWRAMVDSESALNAAFAAGRELPELVGSPKQVAWAVTLRANFLGVLPGKAAKLSAAVAAQGGEPLADIGPVLLLAEQLALQETSAAWWIRNRARLGRPLVKTHARRLRRDATARTVERMFLWCDV